MGIFIGILWLVLVFVVASAAKKRGRSYGGFFAISLFFSPLIGLIILFALGENKEAIQQQNIDNGVTKKCPFCANEIKREAIVCQFCGRDLPDDKKIEIGDTGSGFYIVKEEMKLYQDDYVYDNVVAVLKNGDVLEYIDSGITATIGNKTNRMWKMKTSDDKIGFCFSGFLEKKA
jgi:hypothetical protein